MNKGSSRVLVETGGWLACFLDIAIQLMVIFNVVMLVGGCATNLSTPLVPRATVNRAIDPSSQYRQRQYLDNLRHNNASVQPSPLRSVVRGTPRQVAGSNERYMACSNKCESLRRDCARHCGRLYGYALDPSRVGWSGCMVRCDHQNRECKRNC